MCVNVNNESLLQHSAFDLIVVDVVLVLAVEVGLVDLPMNCLSNEGQ